MTRVLSSDSDEGELGPELPRGGSRRATAATDPSRGRANLGAPPAGAAEGEGGDALPDAVHGVVRGIDHPRGGPWEGGREWERA